jgi:hypothetical protein
MDLIPSNMYCWNSTTGISGRQEIKSLDGQNQESIAIDALTLGQYHNICYWDLSRPRYLYCSASATVNLNGIIVCTSADQPEDLVGIALLPNEEVYLGDWRTPERATGEVMEGGWTRY